MKGQSARNAFSRAQRILHHLLWQYLPLISAVDRRRCYMLDPLPEPPSGPDDVPQDLSPLVHFAPKCYAGSDEYVRAMMPASIPVGQGSLTLPQTVSTKQHSTRRSSMNQERLAQRDKMAQEHQLGVLEMQCTPMTIKGWAIFTGGIVGGYLLIWLALVYFLGNFIWSLQVGGIMLLVLLGVMSLVYLVICFSNETVYIYTNGLVYLNWLRSGVAAGRR